MAIFLSSWNLILKRSSAHWRLIIAVILGVVLAVAITSSTILYFQSLRSIGLERDLVDIPVEEQVVQFKLQLNSSTEEDYNRVHAFVESILQETVGWFINSEVRSGHSSTFYAHDINVRPPKMNDRMRSSFSFVSELESRVDLVAGTLPSTKIVTESIPRPRFEGIISDASASLFDVKIGDHLILTPHWDAKTDHMEVEVVGIFRPNSASSRIWTDGVLRLTRQLSLLNAVPVLVTEETYFQGMVPLFPKVATTAGWLVETDRNSIDPSNADLAQSGLANLRATLSGTYGNFNLFAPLEKVLDTFQTKLFFMRVPLAVVTLMIVALILYYIVLLANLLVGRQQAEIALIHSRGASRSQILLIFAMEGFLLSIFGFIAGPPFAALGIALLGYTPAFSQLSGGELLYAQLTPDVFRMAFLGAILVQIVLLIPAVKATNLGIVNFRQQMARPVRPPFYQRFFLDVILFFGTIILMWQLSNQRGLVLLGDSWGEFQVDQLLLLVPSLFLIAVSLMFVRLFPLVLRVLSILFNSRAPVWFSLGLWELARNPANYTRLVLLLIMAAGLGVFTASFGGTLERSYEERARYQAASDLRIKGVTYSGEEEKSLSPMPVFRSIDGITSISPILRGSGSIPSQGFEGGAYTLVALDPENVPDIAWFRDDFSRSSLDDLMETLDQDLPVIGLDLPVETQALSMWVRPVGVDRTTALFAQLRDSNGRFFLYRMGDLNFEEWRSLDVELSQPSQRRRSRAAFDNQNPTAPFRLMSLFVYQSRRQGGQAAGTILVDDIKAVVDKNSSHIIEDFEGEDNWAPIRVSSIAARDRFDKSPVSYTGVGSSGAFLWQSARVVAVRGISPGLDRTPIPAIASQTFLKNTGHTLGNDLRVTFRGNEIVTHIDQQVAFFPTLDPSTEDFLIVPIEPVLDRVNVSSPFTQILPSEYWILLDQEFDSLSVKDDLMNGLFAPTEIIDMENLLVSAKADPLVAAGWSAILLIAYLAVLTLSVVGFVVNAYVSAQQRRLVFASLRSMGLSVTQLVAVVSFEQIVIISIGLAFGTWMGSQIGNALVPFLGVSEAGTRVIPPFIIETNWRAVGVTYFAMGALFASTIAIIVWVFSRIAIARVLRVSDI